jgi:hypothetical protein
VKIVWTQASPLSGGGIESRVWTGTDRKPA